MNFNSILKRDRTHKIYKLEEIKINMKQILVSDIMTREPVSAKPDDNLLTCAKKMVRKYVGSLVLGENKKLVGFLSQRDILWALVKKSERDLSKIRAIDISPKKIAIIKSDATVKEAISKMNKTKFDRLPVVDNGKVVGIITVKDVLNFHPEFYPELEEFMKVRDEQEKLKRIRKKDRIVVKDGMCEECGRRDDLYREDGVLLCASCLS